MLIPFITIWLVCGILVARIAALEARWRGIRIAPLWYLALVALGPITVFTVLLAGETEVILDEIRR